MDAEQTQLIQQYRKLDPLKRQIVRVFSVIYEPISRTSFLNCFNPLGTKDKTGKAYTSTGMKSHIDRLLQDEFLIQNSGQGPQCNPLIVEVATREAVELGEFDTIVNAINTHSPIHTYGQKGPRYFTNERQFLREVRIGIYKNDIKFVIQQFEDYYRYAHQKQKITIDEVLTDICGNPFDPVWFRSLSPDIYQSALIGVLGYSYQHLLPADEAFKLLQEDCASETIKFNWQPLLLTEQLLLRGQLDEAEKVLEKLPKEYQDSGAALWGWLNILRGDAEAAIAQFTIALTALRKGTGKRKVYFQAITGLFFILALIKDGSPARLNEAKGYTAIARQAKHWLSSTYETLEKVIQLQQGDIAQKDWILNLAPYRNQHSLETIFNSLALYWTDTARSKRLLFGTLETFYENAKTAGYNWIALESAELLAQIKPRSEFSDVAEQLRTSTGIRSTIDLLRSQEPWELCLNALVNLQKEPAKAVKADTKQRLAWFVTLSSNHWILQPREQSLNARGEWGKGRNIALKRLDKSIDEFSYLTEQDRRACAELKASPYGYYGQMDYKFGERAIAALVGHPYVFWEDTNTRIEIVKGEPELIVKKGKNDRLTLQLSPAPKENQSVVVVKESPTRLKVIDLTPEHRRIAEILGSKNQLDVPAIAKDQVLAAIHAISSLVTVHSDIGGGISAEEVPADPTPNVHLLPAGTGLKVAMLVRPFAIGGSYYRPGMGGETVIAEVEGKRLQTTRNLKQERKLAKSVIADCRTLEDYEEEDGEWWIEDPEACLELLLDLQELGDRVIISHPEGEKFRIRKQVGLGDFQLKIQRQRDWFAASGEIKIDENSVLEMQRLLALLGQTQSRFIRLEDGQFLALTQEFRKRLDDFRAIAEQHGKGARFHPLAAVAIEDWIDEVGELEADRHWQEHIRKLKEVEALDPIVPSTLQAELRDYQIEGFRWMAKLAHWGVGACLADGMGLGKTLQSIALILTRAANGATLVIAPTSVCLNWISEVDRFAPTLNVVQFGSGDRQKVLDRLQPFDILVCSYGLLQQDDVAQMLAKIEWQTIILDEAQSIKNFATKRSQAAMNLQGGFKLITTGTPIENHLGELWNLFRFINPGLLGSLEQFNERFATPIERFEDKQARTRLRKLIQPFLLRRTKSQVLQELPSRTEIVLHVELSTEERLFYEALRKSAMERLAESDAPAGQKHLQVLAEIMKLRRSCCNSRLVTPKSDLPSAKLQLFGEVLEELLENRHKVLVFSQFVDHLKFLREFLDKKAIAYQYLDGSTSIPERKKRIEAFQSGTGDVFLISLKAGGTGLNLTAADYVIHMDPWWNPAVEDQASDRAHRIGQQRPVTIYRLVAKDTIEDQIVDLHQHKRDLADSLLEGTEISGKVSTDDLLKLIQAG
ncbi:MAG: DEAD/DEAH box helicase [Plectolyngbya sp. WJT66-NPBG17]|jgi:SNF2 family DNA or RNA helicase|nr:DEAD/DEAH box helicase [Plectolyngbya sp. WJT66-NPBG17]MBW4527361.1 DEAD/DEAH box helicase [Phormidium tanganyikae FI6-MK23]